MKFYIFRHGQSTFNTLGKIQGLSDASILTPLGQTQAHTVGERLKDKNIDVILSSPLKRALETAEICNQILHTNIILDNHFIEVNVGEIEGMHFTQVQEKFTIQYRNWRSNDPQYLDFCFGGGESKKQVRDRVFEGLQSYIASDYENIAISTHGIMLSQVLLALGEPFQDISNSAIICLENTGKQLNLKFKGFI